MRLTLLGTGTSFGVPQIGCRCPTCTSADPRDRRTRSGALIETHGKRLLIDTPPELRLQLVAAAVDHVDAILFTHAHADHVHGIDDLRALSVRHGGMLPAYGSRATMTELVARFPYIFDPSIVVHAMTSKPELAAHVLEPGVSTAVAGIPVLALPLPHGEHVVFGYRVGGVAYLTDVKVIPDSVMEALKGLDVLVLSPSPALVDSGSGGGGTACGRATHVLHASHARIHACGTRRAAASRDRPCVRRAGYRRRRGINSAARRRFAHAQGKRQH